MTTVNPAEQTGSTSKKNSMTAHSNASALAPVIEVNDLTKDYGDVRAVDHLGFSVAAGSITGFLGPNGSGKSTTLRALLGLVAPTGWTAKIAGRRYRDLADPLSQVGAMLEATAHPSRSARNHLRAIAADARASRARVEEVLDVVELSASADRRVGGFSLGMGATISQGPAAAALAVTTAGLVTLAALLFARRDVTS